MDAKYLDEVFITIFTKFAKKFTAVLAVKILGIIQNIIF